MVLSDRSLAWLRALDERTPDPVAAACQLGVMARRTPAWTERYVVALDRLIERHPDAGPVLAGIRSMITAPPVACPQVVGIDFPAVVLRRAEWLQGSLYLQLSPLHEDAAARTGFRIVGAEPRMWYLTGIDGTTMDVTGSAVIMRVPLVHGELVFTPGSY